MLELIEDSSTSDRLEPYLLMFTSVTDFGKYDEHISMIDKLFLFMNANQRSIRQKLIITLMYAKCLSRHQEFARAFNLL